MSDEAKFIITVVAGLLSGGLIQSWFNRRKTASDAYNVLLDALNKSGQTIDDLFGMLAEVPQLKSQLKTAQDEIKSLKRQSDFCISLSRTMHGGAVANADYIRKLEHIPPFEPPKFPSGPLGVLQT